MKRKIFLAFLAMNSLFFACSTDEKEQARELLQQAKNSFAQGEWISTKLILDSIHRGFPSQVEVRRGADTLSWRIDVAEAKRNLAFIDSVLPKATAQKDSMKPLFIFAKDTLYQNVGTFVSRKMSIDRNLQRTYLKPYADETGAFFVLCQYYGKANLAHKLVELEADGVLFRTSEEGVFNSFSDGEMICETTLWSGKNADGMANFILEYPKIKVKISGEKTHAFSLTQTDRDAFLETLNFATLLSDFSRLEAEKKRATATIEKLSSRLN